MNSPMFSHPSDENLACYGLGKLEEAAADSISDHLESCASCRVRVAHLSSDNFLERIRAAHGEYGVERRGSDPVDVHRLADH